MRRTAGCKANLHWVPDPAPTYITARVVADAGGVYARAVLLSVGPNHGIRKGEIALDERGLVGRVTEVGTRSARVLLLTDLNSRIPVILESSRARAIMVGTNGARPRLLYWPEGALPQEGERVVTSAEANAFPANLPVGVVHFTAANVARGGACRAARPARDGADLRLRPGRHRAARGAGPAGRGRRGRLTWPASAQTPAIRPRPTLGRRLDARRGPRFPAGLHHPADAADRGRRSASPIRPTLLPAVTLACVWFWSLFRPAAMPPPVVFLLGLLLDLLGYLPLGVGVLTLLVVHGLALRWRPVLARAGLPVGLAGVLRRSRPAPRRSAGR